MEKNFLKILSLSIFIGFLQPLLASSINKPSPNKPFTEISPQVEDVEVKVGDPFIEVFVKGTVTKDCFEHQEYHVEKMADHTRIIPRFRTSSPDQVCKNKKNESFRDKAADLDPHHPSSAEVRVLGYQGWIVRKLDLKAEPKPK
jgi:hypothetical protein